jgi:hypothetical protein
MIRILLKALLKGVSGFAMIIAMAMTMAPATPNEVQALGPAPQQFDLVQMRLARAMMNTAPDLAVASYARATGASEFEVRQYLLIKAGGHVEVAQASRRTEAGGALFVAAD